MRWNNFCRTTQLSHSNPNKLSTVKSSLGKCILVHKIAKVLSQRLFSLPVYPLDISPQVCRRLTPEREPLPCLPAAILKHCGSRNTAELLSAPQECVCWVEPPCGRLPSQSRSTPYLSKLLIKGRESSRSGHGACAFFSNMSYLGSPWSQCTKEQNLSSEARLKQERWEKWPEDSPAGRVPWWNAQDRSKPH